MPDFKNEIPQDFLVIFEDILKQYKNEYNLKKILLWKINQYQPHMNMPEELKNSKN